MQKRPYRHDIDGLRAVAVLSVLLFHLNLGFTGGYVGVDIFFVISGYLITGLILKAQSEKRFSLRQFWGRRIRRLAPAVTVMLIGVLLLGFVYLLPNDLDQLGKSAVAQVLLFANIHFAGSFNYFAGPAELKPLLHTWSLALEEQFYLLFPLLLVLCRNLSKVRLGMVFGFIAIASFLLSIWGLQQYPTATFFILPTRAWELLIGSLLFLMPHPAVVTDDYKKLHSAAVLIASAILCGSIFIYDRSTLFPGPHALLPCLATAVLIYCHAPATHTSLIKKLLCSRPLTYTGRISYSLYLWHWPIIVFLKYEHGLQLSWPLTVFAITLSFVAAAASYHWIETPFREGRIMRPQKPLMISTALASLVLLCTGLIFSESEGLPDRWKADIRELLETTNFEVSKQYGSRSVEDARTDQLPALGIHSIDSPQPTFLIWGDSHALSISETCHRLATQYDITGYVASRSNTVPLLNAFRPRHPEAVVWNNDVLEFIRRHKIKHVLLACRWAGNIEVHASGLRSFLLTDEQTTEQSPANARMVFQRNLGVTLHELKRLDVHVWILKQVPLQSTDPIHRLVKAIKNNQSTIPRGVSLTDHQQHQQRVNQILHSFQSDHVQLLDPTLLFYPDSEYSRIGHKNTSYYRDFNHVTIAGSESLLRPLLEPLFQTMADQHRKVDVAEDTTIRKR